VSQFEIGRAIVGGDHNFLDGKDWLTVVNDSSFITMIPAFLDNNPQVMDRRLW